MPLIFRRFYYPSIAEFCKTVLYSFSGVLLIAKYRIISFSQENRGNNHSGHQNLEV